jgi:DHA2 family multidrug resistance protein
MRDRPRIDYIGLGLISLGLGCLQVFLDRGEDDDWLSSGFIQLFAVLSVIGLVGAVVWLLYARHPIVHLRVLKDRNFAAGSLMIFFMAAILYSSAVLLPQLAQTQLGYTATWAGLILSPGALTLTVLVFLASRLLGLVPGRYLIAFGFFCLGVSLLYSTMLEPQIDFFTLASMRMAQTFGLGFLFVPISTLAYATVSEEDHGDAAALNVMFRNVGGAIGISVATALVTSRAQVHMAYLGEHLTPLSQPYVDLLARIGQGVATIGGDPAGTAGRVYRMLLSQASLLAYMDVFQYCALVAFLMVPLCWLFTPIRTGGGAPGGH